MMTSFRLPAWVALKRGILCLGVMGALHAAAMTRADAAPSASCTAVNGGAFNLTNPPFDPGNTSILTSWAVGERITATFTGAIGGAHTDGFFHGPTFVVGVFGPLAGPTDQGTVPDSGSKTLMHTVVSSDLTNGIVLDPENADFVTATCVTPVVLTSTPSSNTHFGQSYSQANVGSGGTSPYSYSLFAGTLPTGTSLNTVTGTVSGALTGAGTFSYTIQITDSSAAPALTASQVIAVTVAGTTSTTTTVSSSLNPSGLGSTVKFTATVVGSGGTPTGTVTFMDGGTTIGTGPLAAGTATFTTSTLSLGSHSITAAYGGDATYDVSTSSTLTQVVNLLNTYVLPKTGNDSGNCPITAPCATLNYALSILGAGGAVTILGSGLFGPVVLTKPVSIVGINPKVSFEIAADSTAAVGCVGAAAGICSVNSGYAVEIAAGAADTVEITNAIVTAGLSGTGALKFTSGGVLKLSNNVYRGNAAIAGPIVSLYPNNPGTTQAQVFFVDSDIGFSNNNSGAIEVKPSANTSLKVQFSHIEVHNASYGIRTDSSLLSDPSVSVTTAVSHSEFFSFANAAVNAVSITGTGMANAVFDDVNIHNANVGVKANGPQSVVILTNSTVAGNGTGVQVQNGGAVYTPQNNTISGNGTNISGALTTATPR
jgi:hypothetical protein